VNFGLLWIDALVASLLWVAALAAFVGRAKRRWVRGALIPLVIGGPLFALGTFAFAAGATKFVSKVEPNWFTYALSLLLAYTLGAALITRLAARRDPGPRPSAASWRRMPLVLACLAAVAIGYMTLLNMDLAIRARCAIQSVQVNSIYLATLPAITSESQNAAPLYEKAFANLQASREEERAVLNPPTGLHDKFDPDEPATIAFLAHQASTIELLRRAAALPACRFDRDLGDFDINTIFPFLNAERNAANVLNLHAREEVARGHVSSAIADAVALLRMGRQFGQRPTIVSGLVGIGIDAMGNATLETALPAVTNPSELSELHLDDLPSVGRVFRQSLRGEERWGLTLYANMPASMDARSVEKDASLQVENSDSIFHGPGFQGAFFRVFFLNSDAYVRLMEGAQNLIDQPYYKARNEWADLHGPRGANDLFTSIIFPAISRIFETCARVQAGDGCAQAAVAMTRFRLDHGTLPSRLADLVPAYLEAVPTDPFDGKPLRLSIKGDTWIIYSIGPDCIDDGGVEMSHGKGDVIFRLRSVAAAAH
jgi:hypothetical protein